MAITAFTLGGYDVTGGTTSGTTAKILGGTYDNLSTDVLTSDSTNEIVNVSGEVDTNTLGTYVVTYTATDDAGDGDVVFVETVTVAAGTYIDTEFDLGNESRTGEDLVGTKYDQIVDAVHSGTPVPASASAIFDEGALDPYEVANS